MSDKRASLEIIALSVEEAIAKGLGELGLPEEAVEVEVLDEGSRGMFGLGTRQARIRLTIKGEAGQEPSKKEAPSPPARPEFAPTEPRGELLPQESLLLEEESDDENWVLQVVEEVITELLARLKVRASVSAEYQEADEPNSRPILYVDIRGEDLSILIGPQAETLSALQYIAGLIIGKRVGRPIPLMVDVEGYRARRAHQIKQLALRMADQAMKTGRRQVLEPMPANERRLIHIELRGHPQVTTESIGEEPRRKVTIIPRETSTEEEGIE